MVGTSPHETAIPGDAVLPVVGASSSASARERERRLALEQIGQEVILATYRVGSRAFPPRPAEINESIAQQHPEGPGGKPSPPSDLAAPSALYRIVAQ